MWANRTSYPPTPAWPGWESIRSKYQRLASGLANDRSETFRRQLANHLQTSSEPLAHQLDLQTVRETKRVNACDAQYCRIGYQMAYGQQALAIAAEAEGRGKHALTRDARSDGNRHIASVRNSISRLVKIIPASGTCVQLEDVKQNLEQVTRTRSPSDAVLITQAQWTETLHRIQNLSGSALAGTGDLPGTWYNAQSGQKIEFSEKDGQIIGYMDGKEASRFRMTANNRYAGSLLVTTHSGSSAHAEWKQGATARIDNEQAYIKLGQFEVKLVKHFEQSTEPANTTGSSNGDLTGYWEFVPHKSNTSLKRDEVDLHFSLRENILRVSPYGNGFRVENCLYNSFSVWGDLRKEGQRYIGRWASVTTNWGLPNKSALGKIQTCLSSPDCVSPNDSFVSTLYGVEFIPDKNKAHITFRPLSKYSGKPSGSAYSRHIVRVKFEGNCGSMTYYECKGKFCGMECLTIGEIAVFLPGPGTFNKRDACDRCYEQNRNAIDQCILNSRKGRVIPIDKNTGH